MLTIILMIKLRYIILPLLGVLYLMWTIKAIQDFRRVELKTQADLLWYTGIWIVVTFIAGLASLAVGGWHLLPFIYTNW